MNNYKEKKFMSAVVYVYNESRNINQFLNRLSSHFKNNFEEYEIICVNDASTDDTIQKIKDFSKDNGEQPVCIVNMGFYQGLETSMNAGIDLAIGDFVYEFDSLLMDYDDSLLLESYFHLLDGYDIVSTSNSKKLVSSNLFYWIYNRSSNSQYQLVTETFRILSRRAINRIHSMSKTIPYRKALYANCGLKMDVIKYVPQISEKKTSSKNLNKKRKDVASTSLILFTDVAYKFATFMSIAMMIATLGGVIYTIVVYVLGRPVEGYTTMMLIMTGSFFGVFAILAIIIKYCAILVELLFKKQKYIIESIEKVS